MFNPNCTRNQFITFINENPDSLFRATELARAVDVMMAGAKRIYILLIKVNKLFSFSSSLCFLKEIEKMFSMFLSSYRNTRECLGELEKAVETLVYGSCSHSFLVLPNFHPCFSRLFSVEMTPLLGVAIQLSTVI